MFAAKLGRLVYGLIFLATGAAAQAAVWGPNLMPNPGFEEEAERSPTGWRLETDKPGAARLLVVGKEAAEGKCCLSLELAPPNARGQQLSLTSPGVACEPGWYMASFWNRYQFEGKEQPGRLVIVERLLDVPSGRRDDNIYHYFVERPVVSGQWDHTFILFRIRPGQHGVRFQFSGFEKENRLMLDAFTLRRLNEEALSAVPLEPPMLVKTGIAADPIADPAASEGRAWRCEEGRHVAGAKITWSPQSTLKPGLYRLRFRLRQEQASRGDVLQVASSGDNGEGFDFVRPSDFHSTTDYEEFTVYWFYPFGGGHACNWRYPGSGVYRFDCVVVEHVANVSMPEAWGLLAKGVEPLAIRPPGLTAAGKSAVLLAGLTEQSMGIAPALAACRLDTCRCNLQTMPDGKLGFAPALPALGNVRILIMADVPARALSPTEQLRVCQFVDNGGGLMVFGGFFGYGHGGMKGAFIEDILPVAITRTFDRFKLAPGGATVDAGLLSSLGHCAWMHESVPKAHADVAMTCGGKPFLIRGVYGKGRVVVVLGTVLGEPVQPFWTQPAWQEELLHQLHWLTPRQEKPRP